MVQIFGPLCIHIIMLKRSPFPFGFATIRIKNSETDASFGFRKPTFKYDIFRLLEATI